MAVHPLQPGPSPLDFIEPAPRLTLSRRTSAKEIRMPVLLRNAARLTALSLLVTLAMYLQTGCAEGENEKNAITVFAAASLTDAFREIASEFESNRPDVEVRLNFAGSQRLRSQLELGARADVFASADDDQMLLAQEAGLISGSVHHFASTSMTVIVTEQPGIASLNQLANRGVKVVLAHGSVPAGVYARRLLRWLEANDIGLGEDYAARVLANVVSEETSVKVVEQKVVLGEADAGIVYRPGAITALYSGSVLELPLPPGAEELRALYPIAALKDSASSELADEFIDFVLSREAKNILSSYGFDAP